MRDKNGKVVIAQTEEEQLDKLAGNYSSIIKRVHALSHGDAQGLHKSEQSYGDSWKQRGGVGAFMMLARKWDRIENQVKGFKWDVFEAVQDDAREEGILDDIKDLRRYLFLVEAEMRLRFEDKPK
jgi:hypothetical protein|tara:strand:- start:397 stop:771 length:375 start_codon:yes stop_codon:yes gene_type:complete